ncbi:sulfur carrier protein ThiS [Neorhodopirellula pilleata]|uniref:Sulfur carrier protein ThiS n=1 Tax=Neorhodopirellula pilleata TaxID=2714738 RepID=A0A5C5ZM71_9BACT|nr:sulfur carrier protein ThiS [Neorhodopirellula pilleata]TWT87941.1 sulfur carrier protein ThiS [Neorhodopirellula pilleata]
MLQITVNGSPAEIPHAMSVAELLQTVEVPKNYLAVEVNEEVVAKEDHGNVTVGEGDRVEVVTLVGGG